MSVPDSNALYSFLSGQNFDFHSIMGYMYYDESERKYVDGGRSVDTAVGTIEYVADWNGFNEGNEDIFIVFKIGDAHYLAEIYNDSWHGDGSYWEITNISRVEEREVTEKKYVKIAG